MIYLCFVHVCFHSHESVMVFHPAHPTGMARSLENAASQSSLLNRTHESGCKILGLNPKICNIPKQNVIEYDRIWMQRSKPWLRSPGWYLNHVGQASKCQEFLHGLDGQSQEIGNLLSMVHLGHASRRQNLTKTILA